MQCILLEGLGLTVASAVAQETTQNGTFIGTKIQMSDSRLVTKHNEQVANHSL